MHEHVSHVQMKRNHGNMNQNAQIAWFLSIHVILTRGLIAVKNLEDVAFEMYTNSAKLFDLNEQYFSFLRVPVHISVFEFHFFLWL